MKTAWGFFVGVIFTMILTFTVFANAADVTLAWDANTEQVDGYRIFQRDGLSAVYDYETPAWQGSETQGTVTDLVVGTTYSWVVRAYRGDLESADSIEVQYEIPKPSQTIVYPSQPEELIIKFKKE